MKIFIKDETEELMDVSFGSNILVVEKRVFPNRYSQIMESFFILE